MVLNCIRKIKYCDIYGYVIERNNSLSKANNCEIYNVFIDNKLIPLKENDYKDCGLLISLADVISVVNINGLNKLEVYSVFKSEYDNDGECYYLIIDEFKRLHWYNIKYFLTTNLNGEGISEKLLNERQEFADQIAKKNKENIIKEARKKRDELKVKENLKNIKLYASIFEKYIPLHKDKINLIDYIRGTIYLSFAIILFTFICLSIIPILKFRIIIALISLLSIIFIFIKKINNKTIEVTSSLPDLRPLQELSVLDNYLFSKIMKTILFVDKLSRECTISPFIAEKIISTFVGMANLYKDYKNYTGKELEIDVITSMDKLVDSVDKYIQSLLSANDEYKKNEREKLDVILSDFAISNSKIFDSMSQFNNAFKNINK